MCQSTVTDTGHHNINLTVMNTLPREGHIEILEACANTSVDSLIPLTSTCHSFRSLYLANKNRYNHLVLRAETGLFYPATITLGLLYTREGSKFYRDDVAWSEAFDYDALDKDKEIERAFPFFQSLYWFTHFIIKKYHELTEEEHNRYHSYRKGDRKESREKWLSSVYQYALNNSGRDFQNPWYKALLPEIEGEQDIYKRFFLEVTDWSTTQFVYRAVRDSPAVELAGERQIFDHYGEFYGLRWEMALNFKSNFMDTVEFLKTRDPVELERKIRKEMVGHKWRHRQPGVFQSFIEQLPPVEDVDLPEKITWGYSDDPCMTVEDIISAEDLEGLPGYYLYETGLNHGYPRIEVSYVEADVYEDSE